MSSFTKLVSSKLPNQKSFAEIRIQEEYFNVLKNLESTWVFQLIVSGREKKSKPRYRFVAKTKVTQVSGHLGDPCETNTNYESFTLARHRMNCNTS